MQPKIMLKVVTLLHFMMISHQSSATGLPTQKDVDGILKLCSGGITKEVEGNFKAEIVNWMREVEGGVKFARREVGALFEKLELLGGQDKIVAIYKECVQESLKVFLGANPPLIEYEDPNRQLHALYGKNVRSRFRSDNVIATTENGKIISFDTVDVRVQWVGDGATFKSIVHLPISGNTDERPLAYCVDPEEKIELEYEPYNDCISPVESANCLLVTCR